MPLIVSYPGQIPADARSDAIIENIDFPVTLLDFAGCSAPDYMQGSSFRSILQSGKEPNDWKEGCLLSILDAYGTSRRAWPYCNENKTL